MAQIEKTVFISYRRADVYTALALYENLKNQGYDVFFDYTSISSGDFEQLIYSNIRARAHFVLILTPTALDRCQEPGDWLRREIELAIDEKRNIVPLFFKGFRFGTPSSSEALTGKLSSLSRYNGLNVPEDYFEEAMYRLRTQYLNIPLNTVLHPVSTEVWKVVREEQLAADKALEEIEDAQELVKGTEEKSTTPNRKLNSKPVETPKKENGKKQKIEIPQVAEAHNFPGQKKVAPKRDLRHIGGIAAGLLLIAFLIWGAANVFSKLPNTFQPTPTFQPVTTRTSLPTKTNTPTQSQTAISATPTLGIGSGVISGQDGMTLLYIPAGEFPMGSANGDSDELPIHTIYLDAFWIDETEVTNEMYSLCVQAGACKEPANKRSYTRLNYYGNDDFKNFPVIYVDWSSARDYCAWSGRRLPTEAEWEKAARGLDSWEYPWGNNPPSNDLTNYGRVVGDTTEVGKYPNGASVYGGLDMAGNVWEWVADYYDSNYYGKSPALNATGPISGAFRVLRGGSWYVDNHGIRTADRINYLPTSAVPDFGFRCAMSATQ